MELEKPFKLGEDIRCKCPDGVCSLPQGLPPDAPVKILAAYFGKSYVLFDGKSYLVPNICLHREPEPDRIAPVITS